MLTKISTMNYSTHFLTPASYVLFPIRGAVFAVGFSTRVVSSAPRPSRGAELMTSFESRTANTAPRIGNSFSNSLNIDGLEGIEPFVVFEKKKLSIDARLNNMGGCSHNLVHLYMCLMAK